MKPNSPVHYVDTCIFIEALTSPNTEAGRDCARYLKRLGNIYSWSLGTPVLLEFYLFMLHKEKAISDELHDFFWTLFQDNQPKLISPETGHDKADYVQGLDSRLEFMDSLHLANAIENSHVFVTVDNKLLGSALLEQRLGLKILHPADLL